MSGEIFFNGRDWRKLGLNEQQVRFLELLYNRAGGAQEVTVNLSEVNNIIVSLEGILGRYEAQFKKLEHRINQLENEH